MMTHVQAGLLFGTLRLFEVCPCRWNVVADQRRIGSVVVQDRGQVPIAGETRTRAMASAEEFTRAFRFYDVRAERDTSQNQGEQRVVAESTGSLDAFFAHFQSGSR